MNKFLIIALIIIVMGVGVYLAFNNFGKKEAAQPNLTNSAQNDNQINNTINKTMQISSPAFKNKETIPAKYTCDGANINPPLVFEDIPAGVQNLVLIVDDPDAPAETWTHWIVWNIDLQTTTIEENSAPAGAVEGKTSFGKSGYGGPCPPSGAHRYFFKLYALDVKLNLPASADVQELEEAMKGRIIESAELVGLYSRK